LQNADEIHIVGMEQLSLQSNAASAQLLKSTAIKILLFFSSVGVAMLLCNTSTVCVPACPRDQHGHGRFIKVTIAGWLLGVSL